MKGIGEGEETQMEGRWGRQECDIGLWGGPVEDEGTGESNTRKKW